MSAFTSRLSSFPTSLSANGLRSRCRALPPAPPDVRPVRGAHHEIDGTDMHRARPRQWCRVHGGKQQQPPRALSRPRSLPARSLGRGRQAELHQNRHAGVTPAARSRDPIASKSAGCRRAVHRILIRISGRSRGWHVGRRFLAIDEIEVVQPGESLPCRGEKFATHCTDRAPGYSRAEEFTRLSRESTCSQCCAICSATYRRAETPNAEREHGRSG